MTDGSNMLVLASKELVVDDDEDAGNEIEERELRDSEVVGIRLARLEACNVTNVVLTMVVSKTVTVDKGMIESVVVSSSRLIRQDLESRMAMRLSKSAVRVVFQFSRSRI